jgi:hypothetical protein
MRDAAKGWLKLRRFGANINCVVVIMDKRQAAIWLKIAA